MANSDGPGMGVDQTKQQAQTKEKTWELSQHVWCRPGMNVEFVTEFGVRHLGCAVVLVQKALPPRSRNPFVISESVLLMSEDTEQTEYFAVHQVEKWRETEERALKKRLLGQTFPENMEHAGTITPLFMAYLNLRFNEKMEEAKVEGKTHFYDNRPFAYSTYHYENEDRKHQWETKILAGKLIEVEGDECIVVELDKNGSTNEFVKKYGFKEVARAVEDICRHFFEQGRW